VSGSATTFAFSGIRRSCRIGSREDASEQTNDLQDAKQDGTLHDMTRKKNPHARALGRLGGAARRKKLSQTQIEEIASKGGKARARKLTAAERSRIARLAAKARERSRKEGRQHA
jgi:hypothetical protein